MSTRIDRRLAAKRAKQAYIKQDWGVWEHRFSPDRRSIEAPHLENGWLNNIFAVQHYKTIGFDKIMIRRHDSETHVGWSDLQRIKNELFGTERLAVQLFPRQSKLVDVVNMYWFFLVPEELTEAHELFYQHR